eukprot:CAMPEP_0115009602 /NCGR_PEP_ID=MMETSP0216-20121206/22735_1 /TAXON_ID=223996 /ORGANISM="Protocruzia adherens, Strain Boccale" /LENGTH=133 /DNA_ID=CAMNT_0002377491 /DNA_START=157 /DNA_END=558 /DNA_ORIENTATION=-
MDIDTEVDQIHPWSWLGGLLVGIFIFASLASLWTKSQGGKQAAQQEKSRQERLAHFENRQSKMEDEIRETEQRKAEEAEINEQRRNNRKQLEELQAKIRSEQDYKPDAGAMNGGFRNTVNRFKPSGDMRKRGG